MGISDPSILTAESRARFDHRAIVLHELVHVRDPTTWTILQKMTLITSDCGSTRSLSIKWP